MALKLSSDEREVFQANLHWSNYILSGVWATFGFIILLPLLFLPENPKESGATTFFLVSAFFFLPLIVKWLKNKCKTYAVTTKRLYVEEGILSKTKTDIPFDKINDIEMSQGLIQRMFGSGDITVLSGNSIPVKIKDIDNPNEFKEHLFNTTKQKE